MKCPSCKLGRLISKIVRERQGEVYRRRYCNYCPAKHTTLERVVLLNGGERARKDIDARAVFNPGKWWKPDVPKIAGTRRIVRA